MRKCKTLPYDPLKRDFINFKINIISVRNCIADMVHLNGVISTFQNVIQRVVIQSFWYDIIQLFLQGSINI